MRLPKKRQMRLRLRQIRVSRACAGAYALTNLTFNWRICVHQSHLPLAHMHTPASPSTGAYARINLTFHWRICAHQPHLQQAHMRASISPSNGAYARTSLTLNWHICVRQPYLQYFFESFQVFFEFHLQDDVQILLCILILLLFRSGLLHK